MSMIGEGKETTFSSAGVLRYRLGDITIDVDRRRVERAGDEIRLTKLTFDLLVALAEAAPRVVSREELGELLWLGRYVTPETIKQRVLLLRQALADSAEHPRYIRVVRGQGYGLIPDVEVVAVETRESRYWQRPATWATVAALSLALIAAALIQNGLERNDLKSDDTPSVAVLPSLSSSAGGESAYFSEGIAEDIRRLLARVPGLRIVSMSLYRDGEMRTTQMASALGVDHVLKVTADRTERRVNIAVELVDAPTERVLWSRSYVREIDAVFAIQEEITAAVVNRVQDSLLGALPTPDATKSEAYLLYMHARYINDHALINSLVDARRMLEKAIELDDRYLPARLELTRTFNLMAGRQLPLGEARQLARKTINAAAAIWPNRPTISAWRAYVAFRYDGDYGTAARYFEDALSMDPGDTDSLRAAMVFALFLNRPADSIRIARYLLAREPWCMACYIHILIGHIKSQQYTECDEIYAAAKSWNLDRGSLALNYAWALILRGDAAAALAERTKFGEGPGMDLADAALSAVASHALGHQAEFDANFAELHALADRDNNLVPIARVRAMTGDMDGAFVILDAMPELDPMIFDEGPRGYGLHDMRQHPLWPRLARKAGLWPDPREEISFNVALP